MIVLRLKLGLPLGQALYEAISLMFFASSLDFSTGDLFLEILWITFPLFGLILLGDGLAGIGTAIKFGDPTSEIWNQEVSRIMKDHYRKKYTYFKSFLVISELLSVYSMFLRLNTRIL